MLLAGQLLVFYDAHNRLSGRFMEAHAGRQLSSQSMTLVLLVHLLLLLLFDIEDADADFLM